MNELQQFSVPLSEKYFNPNSCAICYKTSNKKFITCDQCHMISYCSKDHKLMSSQHHVQICTALQNVSKRHPILWSTYKINLEQWIQTRKQLVRLVKLELQRDLEPFEVQIITLAKSCFICYKQTNLFHCTKCHSINYCHRHESLLGNRHKFYCKKMELSLWENVILSSHPVPIDRFAEFPDKNKPVFNMDTFIEQFVKPKHIGNTTTVCYSRHIFYSDYASGPLTLFYGIQKIKMLDFLHKLKFFYKLDSDVVVHIIDANFVDRKYILAWELLLHLLPNTQELKIILIGPELRTESNDLMVCTTRCAKRCLNFEAHRMLYHNYVNSECYKRPDIIIGFQVNLSDWKPLSKIILKIKHQECPFLLTSKSKDTAEQNVNKIKEILKSRIYDVIHLVYNGENNYKSNRSYQDFETADISYRNKYLTVFQKL